MGITETLRRFSFTGAWLYAAIALFGFAAAVPAGAAPVVHTLAILPFSGARDSIVGEGEKRQLVQTVRGLARRNLPAAQGWIVLTGQALEARAPSGSGLSGCDDEACAIDLGRKLQVDYIVAGNIGRVGPYLEASFSLYDVANGRLLGSEWPRGKTVEDIVDSLEGTPDPLFASLGGSRAYVGSSASSSPAVVQAYPSGPRVVTTTYYHRRPVYVNPLLWLWIPFLVLFFWVPVYTYHR